ncbi:accessory gene regulator ArgB-like protein [Bacillus sp. FJAT-26390]|uniref:accessory gene regulator ArgB-like protein n=1 Tax=Bacillus sp. FJAT-26390 TaxID=1743142 RepID=UPI000807A374|nr:accessory gene regulator B family protein [Bacillus sp. FJAT-26390]OBZ08032.1 accessory regulator AgrB [Bacillus sp. FJAT-26390]
MIEALAGSIANRIKTKVPEHPTSVAVLKYSLSLLLNAVFIVGLTILISLLTGKTNEAIIVLVSFALLRQVSGGLHLKSGMSCILVSTITATIVSMSNIGELTTMMITITAAVIMVILAPSKIEKQSRIPKHYYPLLKAISTTIVLSNLFIQSDVIAAAFALQALTLILSRR